MLRITMLALSLAVSLHALTAQARAESATIRIEPRPYYGAVVTMEQGVRVWRPLPPTKYMIINPDSRTPLNLSLTDVRENITSHNHHYGVPAGETSGPALGGQIYGLPHGRYGTRNYSGNRGNHRARAAGYRPVIVGRR